MKVLFFLTSVVFSLIQMQIFAQVSGWTDSSGYKQQLLKTGSIRQVIYSPNGTTFYSVTLDSLWRIYNWDTDKGTLLHTQTIDKTPYSKIFSVIVANDGITYSVCGLQTDNTCHAKIYSLKTDSLLHDVILNINVVSEIKECAVVFDSKLRLLKVFYNSYYEEGNPPNGTRYGGTLEYRILEDKSELLRSESGAVKRWSVAVGVNAAAWVGYYHKVRINYNGNTLENSGWMKAFLWNDSIVVQKDLPFEIIGTHTRYGIYATSYFPVITPNGNHYFNIDHQTMDHWSLAPYGHIASYTLPIVPTIVVPSPTNTYLLVGSENQVFLYNIPANFISDSLLLPFKYSTVAISPNSLNAIFGYDDGSLNMIALPNTPSSIQSDFHADITKTYIDSAITFAITSGKTISRYQWRFGDGETDSTPTAIHRYSSSGNYTVQLLVTDTSGVTDTITKQDYITILPFLIPKFSALPRLGKAPLEVQFKDESQGNIISWQWDFGDKQKDTLQHPKHIYTERRYYNVTLTISDGFTQSTRFEPVYITADTVQSQIIAVKKKWISSAVNSSESAGNWSQTENTFAKGILAKDGKIYMYAHGCSVISSKGPYPTPTVSYGPNQSICSLDTNQSMWVEVMTYSPEIEPTHICSGTNSNSGFQIINYREQFLTSFNGWGDPNPYQSKPSTLYFSNKRLFQPSGWTHDFNGAFLPNGTDIFLFRNQYSSSLQFFQRDSVLIAKDSLIGDVMRPLASPDSQSVIVIANPYIGAGDSSRWLIQRTYSSTGALLNEKHIEKNKSIRLTDIADIGWGEFLISGWVNSLDTAGNIITTGYVAKIGSEGRLLWEYSTPLWKSFEKFQILSSGYYAVWGIPQKGFNSGFIEINKDGSIRFDNRLVGASNAFTPTDFILGNSDDEIWFIGSDYVSNQGLRAVVYLCNPVSTITGIEGTTAPAKINTKAMVYPMPASDEITLRVTIAHQSRVELSFISALGIENLNSYQDTETGVREFHISVRELPIGMYRICMKIGNAVQFIPVLVVR